MEEGRLEGGEFSSCRQHEKLRGMTADEIMRLTGLTKKQIEAL